MKRVNQTIFSSANNNLYQAVIASILELPIETVPHFAELYDESNYHEQLQEWLSQFGLMALRISYYEIENGEPVAAFLKLPECYCIGIGKSMNNPGINHAVVGKIINGYTFCLEHDPDPNSRGLLGDPECLEFIIPIMNKPILITEHFGKTRTNEISQHANLH